MPVLAGLTAALVALGLLIAQTTFAQVQAAGTLAMLTMLTDRSRPTVGQPQGRGSPGEFAAALLAVAALSGGIALLGFGAGLFAPAPVPPRAMLP